MWGQDPGVWRDGMGVTGAPRYSVGEVEALWAAWESGEMRAAMKPTGEALAARWEPAMGHRPRGPEPAVGKLWVTVVFILYLAQGWPKIPDLSASASVLGLQVCITPDSFSCFLKQT